jgi:hypothetical protein
LRIEELEIPLDEDGQELLILEQELEAKVLDVLKKEVAPNLTEVEDAALKRYIQSSQAIKNENEDLNERLQAFDEDNKVSDGFMLT